MKVKSTADHFADVRERLAKVWAGHEISRWLSTEHPMLGKSPARAIHSGQHDAVHVLLDAVEKTRG